MSGSLLRAPVIRLRIGGAPVSAGILAGLTNVVVHQQLGCPAQLQLTATGAAAGELSRFASGDLPIMVQVDGHRIDLFAGTISGVEQRWDRHRHHSVVVRADDELHALRAQRRAAVYERRSAVDIAEELLGDVGLKVQTDRSLPEHQSIHQAGLTDLAFLRRILAAHGLQVTLRGDTVHLVDRSGIGSAKRLRPGEELLELSVDRRTATPADTSIAGWVAGRAAAVSTGGGHRLVGWTLDDDFAGDLADAITQRARSLQVVARGVAVGDCEIRPGTRVDLPASESPGRHELMISSAVHRITANEGYVTEFSTEAVDDEPTASPATLTLGVVTDVDDPDRRGRIRVELPAFGDLLSAWMPVVCAGAGDGIGIVALPDVGATVAVLGAIDQPASGVVLGGLFGEDASPPVDPVADGRSRRFAARLPGGAQFVLDANASSVLVENGAGSTLEMTADAVTLHAAADLEIAAPGKHLLFRADRIDFERA